MSEALLEPQAMTGDQPVERGMELAPFQGHIEQLLIEHQQHQARIEALHQVIQGDLRGALSWFLDSVSAKDRRYGGMPAIDKLFDDFEAAMQALHAAYWSRAIALTDVMQSMPQKRKDEWNDLIREHKTPAFERETVEATLQQLLLERGRFFAEKVDGVFRRLSSTHLTNRPEGFWKRFIIDYAYQYDFAIPNSSVEGYLRDLREVIASFMGRGDPLAIYPIMRTARETPGQWLHLDGGSWKIRAYKIGTLHIEIHPDMAWRLNCVLHELHPQAIPSSFRQPAKRKARVPPVHDRPLPFPVLRHLERAAIHGNTVDLTYIVSGAGETALRQARQEAGQVLEALGGVRCNRAGTAYAFEYPIEPVIREVIASGVIPDKQAHQFYPTPPAVAEALIEAAVIDPQHRVLEPSAGTGALAALAPAAALECVEISPVYCRSLYERFKGTVPIHQADFLDWRPEALFDRIVMNPPYSQGRALAHVAHAAQLLKPGGRLVALLPAGLGGSNKLPDGRWGALFERAFAGTDIATRLFIHDRPRGGREQA